MHFLMLPFIMAGFLWVFGCFLHYEHHTHAHTHTLKQTEGDRKSTNCGVSKLVVLSQHGHQIRNPVILLGCCSHDVWMATEIVDQLYPTHSSAHQRWTQPSEKYHPESERRPCCYCWTKSRKQQVFVCVYEWMLISDQAAVKLAGSFVSLSHIMKYSSLSLSDKSRLMCENHVKSTSLYSLNRCGAFELFVITSVFYFSV